MTAVQLVRTLLTSRSPYSVPKRLKNFLYWQLIRKNSGKPLHFRLPDGALMAIRKAENGATSFYYYGYPDYEEMMFLHKNLGKGDLFVDVGANSGGWSLTAFGLGGRAIAIEPIASSFQRLNHNFQLNNSVRLKALNIGVSDREGELLFTNDNDAGNKVTTDVSAATEKVKVTTLDKLLADENPTIMKIDVEGHELSVLRGAGDVLKKKSLRALVIETFRWANWNTDNMKAIEALLAANGFHPVGYHPDNDSFYDLKPSEGGQNTIYIRKG